MSDAFAYITDHWIRIIELSAHHIGIVAISSALAIGISVPVGILVTRPEWRQHASAIIAIGNTFQTVPTLAVIGLTSAALSAFRAGIGSWPAIVALVVYSILPILTNTISGIEQVARSTLRAGKGMGMTDHQILTKIELPLALPVILAGIRTAVVINIGTAALAATIGADCLGTFIFQGISTGNIQILLAGAVPTAVLAVIIDLIFGIFERMYLNQQDH
jgi:ABC-type proline/glycine betaine transport system permease subunit